MSRIGSNRCRSASAIDTWWTYSTEIIHITGTEQSYQVAQIRLSELSAHSAVRVANLKLGICVMW